ncbi:MAG: tetratricopeptide repeat protein [Bacteroidetes bacterium]|jgi:tetratricopeptide (TPR) repeat protein|nr:tetratricopeptide repeat protein [Bacteroidota bacterium]
MKRNSIVILTLVLLSSLAFQGFQCGSPEFTGAKVYINQKNYKEAMRLLEIETQKNPANEEAWFILGQLRAESGDYVGMNVAFNEALKLGPKHEREVKALRYNKWAAHVNPGIVALQRASSDSMQFYDTAIDEFTKSIQAWPDTMLTHRFLGYAYQGKGDTELALQAFGSAWKRGKDTESRKQSGRIYLQRGKSLKDQFQTENVDKLRAVENLNKVTKGALKSDVMNMLGAPDNVKRTRNSRKEEWTYTRYANLVVFIDGERVASKEQRVPYNPNIDSTKYVGAQAEFATAVGMFEEVKSVDPRDNANLNLLLQAYVEADKIREAIAGFRQAVENEPANKLNHFILGVLHRTVSDYPAAIGEFDAALKIDQNYTDALFELGATYYNWGVDMIREAQEKGSESDAYKEKFQAALPSLERVAETKKDDATVWETLGTIYARLGQSDKAMKALDNADKIRKGN